MSQSIFKKVIEKKQWKHLWIQKKRKWNRWWWFRIEDEITDENYKKTKSG